MASLSVSAASAADIVQPLPPEVITRSQVERIHLRPGELPQVNLTADILYRILASEIAAQRGYYDLASGTLLDLARDTLDARLARRAFQFSMADRNSQRSQEAARQWSLLAPDDPEAEAAVMALAASHGQTAGLASALRKRVLQSENREQAIAQAAAVVDRMSDKRLALQVLEQALLPHLREEMAAHLALADAAWAARDAARALESAMQAQKIDPSSEAAAQRALEYGMAVDSQAALARAAAFADAHPRSRKLQLMLVSRLAADNRLDEALARIDAMQAQAPEDFDLLYVEAEVNIRGERYDRAKELLNEYINVQTQRRRSIANDSVSNALADASDARLLLVRIAEQEGNLDDAISQLGQIDDPALQFQARIHQAVLMARQGRINQARDTLGRLSPQDDRERTVVALTLASIYRDSGRTDDAVDVLAQADRELPDTVEIKYDLAMLYERQGRLDAFEKQMRRIIEIDPENANAYNALGYTYADRNRQLDEAGELLDTALQLDPESPFILDSVGWYHYRMGNLHEALDYLQRSYERMPAADVAAHLGEVLWALKRRDEARKIWHEAWREDPENETLLKTLRRFGVEFK